MKRATVIFTLVATLSSAAFALDLQQSGGVFDGSGSKLPGMIVPPVEIPNKHGSRPGPDVVLPVFPTVKATKIVSHGFAQQTETPEASAEQLQLFLSLHEKAILKVPGVDQVKVGIDCPIVGKHVHIRPHMPSLVIRVDNRLSEVEARRRILSQVGALSDVPFRIERPDAVIQEWQTLTGEDREAAALNQLRCMIPEGCGDAVAVR